MANALDRNLNPSFWFRSLCLLVMTGTWCAGSQYPKPKIFCAVPPAGGFPRLASTSVVPAADMHPEKRLKWAPEHTPAAAAVSSEPAYSRELPASGHFLVRMVAHHLARAMRMVPHHLSLVGSLR
mmetsp:Transcript_110854/g.207803  ORF Transcript_110854/g.207803 Transcript_110854/m.207803 type:complete len:125 (+) Transcript_110854:1974-2348(+)